MGASNDSRFFDDGILAIKVANVSENLETRPAMSYHHINCWPFSKVPEKVLSSQPPKSLKIAVVVNPTVV